MTDDEQSALEEFMEAQNLINTTIIGNLRKLRDVSEDISVRIDKLETLVDLHHRAITAMLDADLAAVSDDCNVSGDGVH